MKLFVFGTLKRGFPLHEKGLSGAQYLGRAQTIACYPMLIAGPRYAPMLFNEPGAGHHVKGELYEINESHLAQLNALESLGQPGSLQDTIEVLSDRNGEVIRAMVYFKSRDLAKPIHSGYLAFYELDKRFRHPTIDQT